MGDRLKSLFPGVAMAFMIAAASTFLSEHYHAPATLFALLLGMSFNSAAQGSKFSEGLNFTTRTILRVGVAFLGARVSLGQITSIGIPPLAAVVISIPATILLGWLLAKLVGANSSFGILTGSAVAICGASAALAVSAVLPPSPDKERDTSFTVMAITALSTLAMITYPIIFTYMGIPLAKQGILIGATIHDVAQVVGAGFSISEEAGNLATYVKLFRVCLLPVVVIVIAAMNHEGGLRKWRDVMPWFALGFAALLVADSTGLLPGPVAAILVAASQWFLLAAIAALGARTSLAGFAGLGFKLTSIVVIETLFLLGLACASLWFD